MNKKDKEKIRKAIKKHGVLDTDTNIVELDIIGFSKELDLGD